MTNFAVLSLELLSMAVKKVRRLHSGMHRNLKVTHNLGSLCRGAGKGKHHQKVTCTYV